MTGYLRAAIACRTAAAAALIATVYLASAGHLWWAALTGYTALLGLFLGGRCHTAHHHPDTIRERNPA